MKLSSAFSTVLALASSISSVEAAPAANLATRQSRNTQAITGVTTGGIQNRVELRTMQRSNPDQFNLYILGLKALYAVDQSDPLSFYQIAGIHGRPYIPYDGWTSPAGSGGYGGGYCTHVSNLFATWHRPYLALYEQALFAQVQKVANSYPAGDRKNRYLAAAATFRIPYWDWAAPIPCSGCTYYPKLVSNQYISVDDPVQGTVSVLNPLFRYDFNTTAGGSQVNDFVYNPFTSWTVTKRAPTSFDSAGVSQNANVASSFNANTVRGYAQRLVNLFNNYNNFNQFSNEAWISSANTANPDSLESVHDAIHAATGQNGHMTYLDYAAFDPLFWLHHANVDRIWAMWSTIYPNTYVPSSGSSTGNTYMTPAGSPSNVSSPLYPFSKDTRGTLYTSNDVASTNTFGYTYADIAGGSSGVKTVVNTLYNSGTNAPSSRKLAKRDTTPEYHYVANIASQKWKLGGSYGVYLFMGEPTSSKPSDWWTASNLVGFHGVTANLGEMASMTALVTGTVPVTNALGDLVKSGVLPDMSPSTVEPYLTKNLSWRVAMFGGQTVDNSDVPGLSVTVVSSKVTPAASKDQLDTWGDFTSLANVTANKAGGHDDTVWAFSSKSTVGAAITSALSG